MRTTFKPFTEQPRWRLAPTSGVTACVLLAILFAAFTSMPAMAIDFPAIPGVSANDDPITILVKVAAFIMKAVVYIIFVAVFAVGAYVAIATLLKMIKDRENAADLVGKLMASVVVVVVCYWFLAEGEKAADALRDVRLTEQSISSFLHQSAV